MSPQLQSLPADAPVLTASVAPARAWIALSYLSLGHFFIDFYSNALGVFAPLLQQQFHLTLTQIGFLGGLLYFSSSLTQPIYGFLFDRWRSPLFASLAPAVAGIFLASMGLAPSYGWLIACAFLGGAGVASFHPAGSSRVSSAGLDAARRQHAMAIFISAGTLGLACGPTFFSYLFDTVGLSRAYLGAIPGVVTSLILLLLLPPPPAQPAAKAKAQFDWRPLAAVWRPLTILYFCVFLRSVVQISFSALLPLYLNKERGYSLSAASHMLSLYLAGGAIGGFIGGQLANRFGGKRVIQISFLGSVPLLALFFFSSTPWISMAGFVLGGLMLLFTVPVNVVMAQELVPSQAGTASALMMGASWGMAGLIAIPLVGWGGDHYSLHAALASLLAAPVIGYLLTLKLETK